MNSFVYQQKIIARYQEFRKYKVNHEDSVYLLKLMFELTDKGFEYYIAKYFLKVYKIKLAVLGGYNDGGIDLRGKNLFIQCKKWSKFHIKQKDILDFWYNTTRNKEYSSDVTAIFITTTRISSQAKKVADEMKIKTRDYRHLLKRRKNYSLEQFEKDEGKNNYPYWTYKIWYFRKKIDVESIINEYIERAVIK